MLIQQDLSPEQLKGLYQQCRVLVSPSRAEGFGLPMAEAILSGLSVLATAWSGQLDFLADDPHSLIDFEFAAATSHLPVFDSVWAEPSVSDFAGKMRWSVDEPQPSRAARVSKLQNRLLADFTWQSVARRGRLRRSPPRPSPRLQQSPRSALLPRAAVSRPTASI